MTVMPMSNRLQTEVREFLKLAVPLASAQVAQSATGFADTVMMGRMGAEVLAAGGLAAIIFLSIMTATSGMVMGVSPLIAEAFGAGQPTRIQQLARQGLWLAVMVSIPMMLVTGHLDRWMIHAGQTETTVRLANTYLDIMLWGLFPAVGFAALRGTVAALSQARPVMFIVASGVTFNVVWNYILGFGKLGFPAMGLAGLALRFPVRLAGHPGADGAECAGLLGHWAVGRLRAGLSSGSGQHRPVDWSVGCDCCRSRVVYLALSQADP